MAKVVVILAVNFAFALLLRGYVIRRPIPYWLAVFLYIFVISVANIAWAAMWNVSLVPGALFFIAFVYIMSNGYQPRSAARKAAAADNQTANDTLERATRLLAAGKQKDALNEYRAILSFQPRSDAAAIAKIYAEQIEADLHNNSQPSAGAP